MLIQFLDHLLESWGLALLANVDTIWIDLNNVAHLEVFKLKFAVLLWFTLRIMIPFVKQNFVRLIDLSLARIVRITVLWDTHVVAFIKDAHNLHLRLFQSLLLLFHSVPLLLIQRVKLIGEVIFSAHKVWLLFTVNNELGDLKTEDAESHDDGGDGEGDDLVAPAQEPDCVDVRDQNRGRLEDAAHGKHEERSDHSPEPVLADDIEIWLAAEVAVENSGRLERVQRGHGGDDA